MIPKHKFSWNIQRHGQDMRETNIMDNLNCKMQARKYGKNDAYWNNFVVKDASLEDHIGRVERCIKMIFSRMIYHNIKVLVLKYLQY